MLRQQEISLSIRSRTTKRMAVAALTLGIGLTGVAPALADDGGLLGGGLLGNGLLGGLLGGDQGLISGHGGLAGVDGGIIAGDGDQLLGSSGLLDGLLFGVATVVESDDALTVGGDEPWLQSPSVGGGLLGGLLGFGAVTDGLAGRL